jgi:Zn-dependent peptidase ImmA (M78 family)/DNA-binding XRE family transcriptional regulator
VDGLLNFRMLRLARELRGLTQTGLAVRAELAQARISRIESGQLDASGDDVSRLASALDLPAAFFYEPGSPAAAPLFRKRAIRSVRKLAAIQARLNTAVLVAQRLLDAGVDIDPPQHFPDVGEFAPDEPARAASRLRQDWRLPFGRIDDVTVLIEAAAGIVLRVDFGSDDATAAFISTPDDGRMWFLVNTRENAGDRIRLSLAHELGHAVLHRMLPSQDEGAFERQAFTFATALLLPPEQFDRSVPLDALTLTGARQLKRAFGVSIQAIIRTAYERGRISRNRYTSLFKQLSARQWRITEPDPVRVETAHLWPEVIAIHRESHGFCDADMAAIARVRESMLSDLFPEEFTMRRPLSVVRTATPSIGARKAPA